MNNSLRNDLTLLSGSKEFDPDYAERSEAYAILKLAQEGLIASTAFGPELAQGTEETFQIIQERELTIKERAVLSGLIIKRIMGVVDPVDLEFVRAALFSFLPSETSAISMSDERWRYSVEPEEISLEVYNRVKAILRSADQKGGFHVN